MKTMRHVRLAILAIMATALASHALTLDKQSIESIAFNYANYRDYESILGSIEADVPLYHANNRTFFTAALGAGRMTQNRGASYDQIALELGVRYQLFPVTSVALAGSQNWFLGTPNYDVAALHLKVKQAFLPDSAPLIPFVRANGNLQFIDPVMESPARQDRNYRLLVLEAIAGVELRIRKDFRWVFEAGRSQSQAVGNAGPDLADGWIGRIAMQYDWF